MQNPDILRHIAILLDYESLIKLGRYTNLTSELTWLLADESLWKQKVEYLANLILEDYPDANWVQIFHKVAQLVSEPITDTSILSEIYQPALQDLTTLRIFLAVRPAKHADNIYLDQLVNPSSSVLMYLMNNKYARARDFSTICLMFARTGEVAYRSQRQQAKELTARRYDDDDLDC